MLNKQNRLTTKKDFELISQTGKSLTTKYFIIKYRKNNIEESRFGIIISNKISKKAVERNKIKRRIREIIKKDLNSIKKGYDIALFAKQSVKEVDYNMLKKDILDRLKHKNLLYDTK